MVKAVQWLAVVALVMGGALFLLLDLTGTRTRAPAVTGPAEPARIRKFDVVAEYPHDPTAFTQGLIYADGFLYESTGREGRSSLRKVELKTGRVVQRHALDNHFVGEGLTEWRGRLIQFTPMRSRPNLISALTQRDVDFWVSVRRYLNLDTVVRYDFNSLEPQSTFSISAGGWGLTHDDHQLIKSDGTSILRFLNPDTMKWQEQIEVTDNGTGVRWLNELEFINGEVYANIWQQDRIAIIQLDSARVTGWIDLSELRPRMIPSPKDVEELGAYGRAVANGIAYDRETGRLFVTGKNWPRLFEIRLRN